MIAPSISLFDGKKESKVENAFKIYYETYVILCSGWNSIIMLIDHMLLSMKITRFAVLFLSRVHGEFPRSALSTWMSV